MCRRSLTDQSFRQITCLCLCPVITHIHKCQWPTNLRLPAVLHCLPGNRMALSDFKIHVQMSRLILWKPSFYYCRAFLPSFSPLRSASSSKIPLWNVLVGYEWMISLSLWVGVLRQALIPLVWMSVACAKLFGFTSKGKMRGHCPTQTLNQPYHRLPIGPGSVLRPWQWESTHPIMQHVGKALVQ